MIATNTVILIPARYKSSRFPGKPLTLIGNRPMIAWTMSNAQEVGVMAFVVTDDSRIEKVVLEWGGKCLRVDDDLASGTDRIYHAYDRFLSHESGIENIINLQGDEPLLKAETLRELIEAHQRHKEHSITTLLKARSFCSEDYFDPNIVKVDYCPKTHSCRKFTRSPLAQAAPQLWYQHIGIYCYRKESLKCFVKSPATESELSERLEQLRAMDLGLSIGAIVTNASLKGVDTPQDVQRVNEVLAYGQKC